MPLRAIEKIKPGDCIYNIDNNTWWCYRVIRIQRENRTYKCNLEFIGETTRYCSMRFLKGDLVHVEFNTLIIK